MYRVAVRLIGAGIMWLGVSAAMQVSRAESLPGKLAYWSFDQDGDQADKESISGNRPLLAQRWQQVDGVKGKAVLFDGFTSYLTYKTKPLIEPGKGFAIEAWVAVAAYPWNVCPIVAQQDAQGGIFFGLNDQGELCLSVGRAGKWQGWIAQPAIPVRQWTHVACSFTPDGQGTLFINGQAVSCKPFDVKLTATKNHDLWIGRGPEKQAVANSYITSHRPIHIYFDGIIDELSIMDGPVNAEAMADRYRSNRPVAAPPLPPRVLKAGPEKTDGFGANHTSVKYYPQWDDQWRVGNSQDIVVTFDGLPSRLVFWRGTGYIPCWVSENNIWVADQSLETWGKGCAEAMSDKHCRSSHVRVIESTDARAVVHWRYYLLSADYSRVHIDDETDWSDCADEYFHIYPDGTAVRHQVLWSTRKKGFSDRGFWTRSHQWQETIPFTQPGQKPEDVIELEAFTVADMAGKSHTYSWANGQPEAFDELPQANIQLTNIKAEFRPFVIYPPEDCRIHPFPKTASHLSKFPWWNHWPVAQIPSDGRPCQASDRVGSFSLSFTDWAVAEETERMQSKWSLVGSTDKAAGELATLAKSWISAPAAKARSGCEVLPYSRARREYPVVAKDKEMIFTVEASEEQPIDNLCLTVRNWGHKDDAKVLVNGKAPEGLRQGTAVDSDGHDYLVTWVEMQTTEPVEISISGACPSADYVLPDHLVADADTTEKTKRYAAQRAALNKPVSKAAAPVVERAPFIHVPEEKVFDGSTAVECKAPAKLKTAETMTWSAWVKTESDGTIMALTGSEDKWIAGGISLFIKNGYLTLDIGWQGAWKGPGGISDGLWHHVAMSQVDNGIHLYLDGKLHSSHICLMDPSMNSLDRFKIGFTNADFPKPSPYFKGQMKNVAVYDYAMTDEMVKKDFMKTSLENE